ncbi:MAG TPA: hypothetical protein PLK80_12205 [bacterium]|nr:hypothetical protein [bacterium]HPI77487.1 hypothetical protein [bacterium]HPN94706.1 hypothetical protein [bacterium]
MLRLDNKPDKIFQAIVTAALEIALDNLKQGFDIYDDLSEQFGRDLLEKMIAGLLEAHESEQLYGLNAYHFLVLYAVVQGYVELKNDDYRFSKTPHIFNEVKVKEMDFDAMADYYFGDLDFLFNPEFYNHLSAEEKERFAFSEGLFGVINKMIPTEEEITLKECRDPDFFSSEGLPYRNSKSYPFLKGQLNE